MEIPKNKSRVGKTRLQAVDKDVVAVSLYRQDLFGEPLDRVPTHKQSTGLFVLPS